MEMRLQRFLSQAGVASRRRGEDLIVGGHVRVNGKVVNELGSKVDPARDRVAVDGKQVAVEEPVFLLLNKPRGYVTTLSDPEKRPTVMELVRQIEARIFPIGRLDFNTEGILLLTNDGDLANGLMHPRNEVEKIYRVKLRGEAGREIARAMSEGVRLDDGSRTDPTDVVWVGPSEGGHNTWLEVTLREGKNRQIHRMAEALGFQVAKLERVRYAGLETVDVPIGRWRHLTPREIKSLRKIAGLAGGGDAEHERSEAAHPQQRRPTAPARPAGRPQAKARANARAKVPPKLQARPRSSKAPTRSDRPGRPSKGPGRSR